MVVILGADPQETGEIGRLIQACGFAVEICTDLEALNRCPSDTWLATLLDIDSIPLDNRTIRDLTLSYPAVAFFCTSRQRFHPEIKEAICNHLFACLKKPIDGDELDYLLKCVRDGQEALHPPPDG